MAAPCLSVGVEFLVALIAKVKAALTRRSPQLDIRARWVRSRSGLVLGSFSYACGPLGTAGPTFFGLLGGAEFEPETAAFAGGTDYAAVAAHAFHCSCDDGEADAGAVVLTRRFAAFEDAEDFFLGFW